jgi:hypothetical protein
MLEKSWVAELLAASQKGLSSMHLIIYRREKRVTILTRNKRKVILSLCLINKALCLKDIWGNSSTLLDLVTRCRWVFDFKPRPSYPRERTPGTHCIGGWGDTRAGSRIPVVQPVACHYTDCYWNVIESKWEKCTKASTSWGVSFKAASLCCVTCLQLSPEVSTRCIT